MEGDRRLQLILISVATVIFALSYIVGYMVGKEAGFEKAKAKFEVEKQRLLKTLAEISPISRPVEDKVVSETSEPQEPTQVEEQEEEEEAKDTKTEETSEPQREGEVQPTETETDKAKEEEGTFYLQLGVFKNAENASRLAEKLREKGYDAKITATASKKYAKVIVGYFSSKEEALKVKEELKKEGYNSILKRR